MKAESRQVPQKLAARPKFVYDFNHFCSIKGKIATTHRLFCLMRQKREYLFNMSNLEVFGVLTGVGVDVSKFFRVGAGGDSESCDSAHLCWAPHLLGPALLIPLVTSLVCWLHCTNISVTNVFFRLLVVDPYRLVISFIALIHIVCCLKIWLHQTMPMGFVFVLKMFQDKCNRDYFSM